MEDVEVAKKFLYCENLSLCIVKSGKVLFKSRAKGLSAFLSAIDAFGAKLAGTSVADRIVGKALALLFIYVGVKAVYAQTLSLKAKMALEKGGVKFEAAELVETITCPEGGTCPFEVAVAEISNPNEAYVKIKEIQNILKEASLKGGSRVLEEKE